jgi:DNA mismatch endonuclease, patch repair protein
MMAGIKARDTKPEIVVRSWLHRAGFRFRVHRRDLPGSPDIVLPRWNAVIFVHGCFWHRHPGCAMAATPRSRAKFWNAKFAANIERDRRNVLALRRSGWRVKVVWECSLKARQLDALGCWIEKY